MSLRSAIHRLTQRKIVFTLSYRHIRARWERAYLKDLYHRRVLLGADPLLSRSAYPNWDYDAEIFAFRHRVGAPDASHDTIVRALTDESYFSRADVAADSSGAQPSKEDEISSKEHNAELISKGEDILMDITCAYLRYSIPLAPEEMIQAVAKEITSVEMITSLASFLGIDVLVRTAEFPPNQNSLSNAFKALIASLQPKRAESLIVNVVLSQLVDVDFIEVFPLNDPLAVLSDILRAKGYKEIEPRIMRSAGKISAEPIFVVGIYADENLIGQSAGETVLIATDMAARESLLEEWQITSEYLLPFGARAHSIDFSKYRKPNFSLKEKCSESTDISLTKYMGEPPLNVVDAAMQYKRVIEPQIGRPLRRRLRHKFSRGSLAKRSFRYMVKPRVTRIC